MPSRRSSLQSIGSLIGQAAAHGLMYGEENRERVLYEWQAREKAGGMGRINEEERAFVAAQGMSRGGRQIREAEKCGKVTAAEVREVQRLLESEIDSIIRQLFSADRGHYYEGPSKDDEEWDR